MPKGKFIEPTHERKYTLERLQELRIQADKDGDTDSRDKLAAKIIEKGGDIPGTEIPEDESKLSRLERLRRDALEVGDTDSAEKLAELIAEEQPEPIAPYKSARLRNALEMALEEAVEEGDTAKVASLTEKLAEAQVAEGDLTGLSADEVHEELIAAGEAAEASAPVTPHNGKNLVRQDAPRMTQAEILQDYLEEAAVSAYHKAEPEDVVEAIRKGEPAADEWLSPEVLAALNKRRSELPPLNGGMDVHVPPEPPPAAPESDGEHAEGPIATEPVNNGTASISAVATIKAKSYVLAEIPAKDGAKVTIHDVRRYERMLSE